MTTDDGATVHLRLPGALAGKVVARLRVQWSACLVSGVRQVRVHVEDQDDLDLPVL